MSLRKKVVGAGVLVAPLFLFMSGTGTAGADTWHDWGGSSFGVSGSYAGLGGAATFDQSSSADDDGASYSADGSWAGIGGAGVFDLASSSHEDSDHGNSWADTEWFGYGGHDRKAEPAGRHKAAETPKCGGGCHDADDNDQDATVVYHESSGCGCHDTDDNEHHAVQHEPAHDEAVVHHDANDEHENVVHHEADVPDTVSVHHDSATAAGPGGASSHGTGALATGDHSRYHKWSYSAGPEGASAWQQFSAADEDSAVYHVDSSAAGHDGAASYTNSSGAFGDD
ncbi:hypothetical protein LWP59_02280 [Amycolatopsis acidiphila]|uniref:Uncharacterized protein n=1 Tax=Amycolatopsis acidiphila TaxID=715473 RepID=A0A557ZPB7_9PSEU|nr:hypothetical protein [Amycolatopsis acidiphila]TVT13867.1 hypothetical protein FNH06_38545 [Amycolatopsis acidiphila]UIJ60539.1 hypothetical protein LWP59_02280 [Amycolatopsis acidiphila]GHG82275.1 hypothetical protein GCM10017788_52700 [Amycolatopsis acidiphila]